MVYFAGHGVESGGKNWLIPVDAMLAAEFDLQDEAVDAERLLEAVSGAKLKIVILDACRDNPFMRSWRGPTRSRNVGLAEMQYDDVVILYAAAAGQQASDGDGANSPFAQSIAKRLPEAGVAIQFMVGRIRDDVLAATGGFQRPYASASFTGNPIYLVPGATAAVAPPPPVTSVDPAVLDAITWQAAAAAGTADAYNEYLAQFPQGRFAKLANQSIQKLTPPRPQPIAPPVANNASAIPPGTGDRTARVAAVRMPNTGDAPEDAYIYGYSLWEAKLYPEAQVKLKEMVEKFPTHRRASYAQNLLGRAYYDEGKPALASVAFYDNYRKMPRGERAAESLYWLGMALTRLKKPIDACKVYAEFGDVFGATASADLKARVAAGKMDANCN